MAKLQTDTGAIQTTITGEAEGEVLIVRTGVLVNESIPQLALFHKNGALVTQTGKGKLAFPFPGTLINIRLTTLISPTGADLIVDVHKNGGSDNVFTTQGNRPKVLDADADGLGAVAVPDVTAIALDDYFQIEIDQVGSIEPGVDLTVIFYWVPA